MLSVIMLSVPFFTIMLSFVMLSAVMLSAVMLSAVMLSVVMLNVVMLSVFSARKAGLLSMMRVAGKFNRYAILWCTELCATRHMCNLTFVQLQSPYFRDS